MLNRHPRYHYAIEDGASLSRCDLDFRQNLPSAGMEPKARLELASLGLQGPRQTVSSAGAIDRTRTCYLRFTKAAHYQSCFDSLVAPVGFEPTPVSVLSAVPLPLGYRAWYIWQDSNLQSLGCEPSAFAVGPQMLVLREGIEPPLTGLQPDALPTELPKLVDHV